MNMQRAAMISQIRDRLSLIPVQGWHAPWFSPDEVGTLLKALEEAQQPRPPAPGVITEAMVESAAQAMFYARVDRPFQRWMDPLPDIRDRYRGWARAALVDAFTEHPAEGPTP